MASAAQQGATAERSFASTAQRLTWPGVAHLRHLRPPKVVFVRSDSVVTPGPAVSDPPPLPMGLKAALIAPAVGVLLLGIFPAILLEFAIRSAKL